MQRVSVKARPSNVGSKKALVGNTAGRIPPSWKTSVQDRANQQGQRTGEVIRRRISSQKSMGSKILMSQLPIESVTERDIEELFRETIGPVFDVFIIFNSQGRSKGMAVVHFQRPADALEARRKYDGKIIDGRKPLKIELIVDPPEVKPKSLAERISKPAPNNTIAKPTTQHQTHRRAVKKGPRRLKKSAEQLDREMEIYMAQASEAREAAATKEE